MLLQTRTKLNRSVVITSKRKRQNEDPSSTKSQKIGPRVHFQENNEELPFCAASSVSTWYSNSEMVRFRSDFHSACQQHLNSTQNSEPADDGCYPDAFLMTTAGSSPNLLYLATSVATRGLEYRCCHERQRRTVRGRQVLLRLARRVDDPTTLAHIAARCNAWSTQLAVQQAAMDWASAVTTYASVPIVSDDDTSCSPPL